MKALEERAFADGVSPDALMEEAGGKMASVIAQCSPSAGRCIVYFGKGHNGGDALVAARYLQARGWKLDLRPAFPAEDWAPLTARKHAELKPQATDPRPFDPQPTIVLDGLLGIGAAGALRGPIAMATREINHLRVAGHARVYALDVPTGLNADNGEADPDAVIADVTLTVVCAKTGLLQDGATRVVGRLAILPLQELSKRLDSASSTDSVATPQTLHPILPRRNFELHKGQCGRVGIIAGSRGFTGAALMAAEACLHAGAGLITLFATEDTYQILTSSVAPEVMVKPVKSYLEALELNLDVMAIGPGLGNAREQEIRQIIQRATQPAVLDADALNMLATNIHALGKCNGPRLLTPHPGEMARLDPQAGTRSRLAVVEAFVARWPHTLLLKGARTIVGAPGRPCSYNTTGTPGMATGGMGDALTGVCAALAGQGLDLYDAARLGAWTCGRAAELAISSGWASEESLTPTTLIAHLGHAFEELRLGGW